MFTVMHRAGGVDRFYSMKSVKYVGPLANVGPGGVHLSATDDPADPITFIPYGQVFVMNDKGATVAKYELGPEAPEVSGSTVGETRLGASLNIRPIAA